LGKIFIIGLSRTGTKSICHNFMVNGYNAVHYPKDTILFSGNYDVAGDISVSANFEKLDKMFANSKFIYTVRDLELWTESVYALLCRKKVYNKTYREKIYGNVQSADDVRQAYVKHDQRVKQYFENRANDLLTFNIFDGDQPQKIYDFLEVTNVKVNHFDDIKYGKEFRNKIKENK